LWTVEELIVLPLVLDVFADGIGILTDGAHEVSARPEGFLGTSLLALGTLLMDADSAFPFEESHDMGDAVFGRDGEEEMNVVGAGISFEHFGFLLLAKLSNDFANLDTHSSVQDFFAVLWYNHDVVLTVPYRVAL